MSTLFIAIVFAVGALGGIVKGPGGPHIWVVDPSGNLVELFQPEE